MTDTRKQRHRAKAKTLAIEKARSEGRLREATSRCGPWVISADGDREQCMKCGEVEFPALRVEDGIGF